MYYFDSYRVNQCNNRKSVILINELEQTEITSEPTPIIKWDNDTDTQEWRVVIFLSQNIEIQYRKKFSTEDSVKNFVDEISKTYMSCDYANLGIMSVLEFNI